MHLQVKIKHINDNINLKCTCCGCDDFKIDSRHANELQCILPICDVICLECGKLMQYDGNIVEITEITG